MPSMVDGIHVVSTETIPGFIIKDQLGVVSGSTVRAKNVVRDFTQMLKNIVGGSCPNIRSYSLNLEMRPLLGWWLMRKLGGPTEL